MRTELFAPALAQLNLGQWGLLEPGSFKRYLAAHGLPPRTDTAASISIDFQEGLPTALRHSAVMVLRLGKASNGPGTQFALVATPNRLDDFFLHEAEPATSTGPERYTPQGDPDRLTPYYVIPNPTETSLVNLAFASGLMGHALGLDPPYPTAAPATGSSTYSFEFRPHSAMAQVLVHNKGQVEIDAAFIGLRGGRRHLFVLEAKSGHRARTIAKHKLVYPVLALAQQPILADMPIIPVYLKIVVRAGAVYYSITECTLPDPRQGLIALDQLVPVAQRQIRLCPVTTPS